MNAIKRQDPRSLPATHVINNDHRFDWTKTTILNHADTRHAREFKEAWHSLENLAINRHIDIPAAYQQLQQHQNISRGSKATNRNAEQNQPINLPLKPTNQRPDQPTNQTLATPAQWNTYKNISPRTIPHNLTKPWSTKLKARTRKTAIRRTYIYIIYIYIIYYILYIIYILYILYIIYIYYIYIYYIYIYIYIYRFRSLKNAVCKLGDRYVVDQTILRHRNWSKSIWCRSFFPCMSLSQDVCIIWTLKPVNDLMPAKEMAFLVLAAGFAFERHLSYRTTYDLKEQF